MSQTANSALAENLTNASLTQYSLPSSIAQPSEIPLRIAKLFDKTASLTLPDIIAFKEHRWQLLDDQVTGYNFMEKDYWSASKGSILWLKVNVPDSDNLDRIWLELLPNIGINAKLAVHKDGVSSSNKGWVWQDPIQRVLGSMSFQPTRYLTFVLDTTGSNKTVYIRLTTAQTFQFSVKATPADKLLWYFVEISLFFGLVAGMLLLALIYNLAIGLKAKEPVYLYYAFYVFCNLLYSAVSTGYCRLLFPELSNLALISNISTCLIIISAFMFCREFLDTRVSIPRFDIYLRAMIVVCFSAIISLPFLSDFHSYALAIVIGVVSPVLALLAAIYSYRKGHPMARYFLIAWSLFLLSAGCWGWMWLGLIEPKEWVVWFYLSGTLMELLLLSMVLGFRFNSLKIRSKSLDEDKARYRLLSETDDLTGVLNRRGFVQKAERYILSCDNKELVWLALDVDNFKRFNDNYGHLAGDDLLKSMGDLLIEKVRKGNVIGRVGGEEFAILLVSCSLENAQGFIGRLLVDFESLSIETEQGSSASTTLSIGATAVRPGESVDKVWKRADDLLYQAKELGRNQVVVG